MDFVDEQDSTGRLGKLLQHRLETLLEITPIFGAGQQCAHVQRINLRLRQDFGNITLDDAPCQPFGNRRFADTGLADQQRIVLAAAAKCLDDALQFCFTSDQRVDTALPGQGIEINREAFQRKRARRVLRFRGFGFRVAARRGLLHLADAVRNVVDHVEPGNPLFLQKINGVRILLAVDGDEHAGPIDFLFSGRLDVQDGALDDALKPEGRLRVDISVTGERW